jgi:protein SCO1/2
MGHNACGMTRSIRIVAIILALAAAAGGGWWATRIFTQREPAPTLLQGTAIVPARALGALDLVDQRGQRFANDRFHGRWSVIYFGFTTCPMICPAAMAELKDFARRVQKLPPAARPQVILITIDPTHDTPQVMGRYVEAFDPAFLGLTGSSAAIDSAAKEFSVARSTASGQIDHSTTLYVVDPRGSISAVFTPPHTAAALAEDYRRLAGS